MKTLDNYFLWAAAVAAVPTSTFFFHEFADPQPPNLGWWISNGAGAVGVALGLFLAASSLTLIWFAVTAPPFIGLWLRLQLFFANLLRLYASMLVVKFGIGIANWVTLPPHFLVTKHILLIMAIIAILGMFAYVMNAMMPFFQRND
jgi:hypothetical protein